MSCQATKARLAAAAIAVFAASLSFAAPSRLVNKVIAIGWDLMFCEPEDVLANAEAFRDSPCDGVGVAIRDKSVFLPEIVWTKESCARYADMFRKFRDHPGLRDSVLEVYFQPRSRLSFADDAAWAHAASNLATAAWVVRKAGLPGVFFDTEDYMKAQQFVYGEVDSKAGLSYHDAARLARRRGRELFAGMFREYPDITLLAYYMFLATPNYDRFHSQLEPAGQAEIVGDLWMPFLNGMLDAAPDTAKIFDGNEDAYRHQAHRKSFECSYVALHRRLQNVIEPENREKFRRVVRQSHGLYLDMYTNEKGKSWYFGSRTPESTRLDRLAENVEAAVRASDGCVWLYGEKHNFIDWKGVHPRRTYPSYTNSTWEAALPGFGKAVRFAKDPYAEMMSALKTATPEMIVRIDTNRYSAALADGASRNFVVGGLATGGRYAFAGEMRGVKAEANLVPAKGSEENWAYGWIYPVLIKRDGEGWVRFATYVRIPPDCDGFKVFQTSRKGSPPAQFRNFKVIRLD